MFQVAPFRSDADSKPMWSKIVTKFQIFRLPVKVGRKWQDILLNIFLSVQDPISGMQRSQHGLRDYRLGKRVRQQNRKLSTRLVGWKNKYQLSPAVVGVDVSSVQADSRPKCVTFFICIFESGQIQYCQVIT